MQHMSYTKGPSMSFASELRNFDKLFDSNRTTSNAEVLDCSYRHWKGLIQAATRM